jgi:uncharacterized protein with GYD domain
MLDNYHKLAALKGTERAKLVKTACRKLKKYGCDVREVYVNMFTYVAVITFEYNNELHDIMASSVQDTWEETKVEVPSILIQEIKSNN